MILLNTETLYPMFSGGPGLYDPCEKDPVDAAAGLSNQEREDITASAQVQYSCIVKPV